MEEAVTNRFLLSACRSSSNRGRNVDGRRPQRLRLLQRG